MKKYLALTAVFVLILGMFTGCGCTRRGAMVDPKPSTEMTIVPTNIPETTAPLLPETEPTVAATELPTEMESQTPTDGNGITDSIIPPENSRTRIR